MKVSHVRRAPTLALFLCVGGLGSSTSPAAAQATRRPDERQQCADDAQDAQRLRSAGRLVEANAKLVACARSECPITVRADCFLWQREVLRDTPSILVRARDVKGNEVRDVLLVVDETRVVQGAGNQAISVDPGEHVIEFAHPGATRVAQKVRLEVGQKNLVVAVAFKPAPQAGRPLRLDPPNDAVSPPNSNGPKGLALPTPGLALSANEGGSKTMLPWIVGGVGALGVGGYAVLYAIAKSQNSALISDCWPTCSEDRIDHVRTMYLAADVSLGVGIAALGTATYLFLQSRSSSAEEPPAQSASYVIDVAPAKKGVFARVSGAF